MIPGEKPHLVARLGQQPLSAQATAKTGKRESGHQPVRNAIPGAAACQNLEEVEE
jgi:hypothetical protein